MPPNQALMQFLFILPKSEYEIEKRTFYNGLQPDRDLLPAIRSRFEDLQRERKKGGARKNVGHAFVAESMRCPDQVCNVCGGKGHELEICGNDMTELACVDRSRR